MIAQLAPDGMQHEPQRRLLHCYDNAMMESFFSTLKSECATELYSSRAEARLSIFEYIEVGYNREWRHSALGYQSPDAFEQAYIWSLCDSTKACKPMLQLTANSGCANGPTNSATESPEPTLIVLPRS